MSTTRQSLPLNAQQAGAPDRVVNSDRAGVSQRSSRRALPLDSLFESCEQRLVLSAQLLAEVVEASCSSPDASAHPMERGFIEPQLSDAHASSGVNQVHHQFGLTGSGQTVAVIDSGIAWDHVALGQGYGPGYRVVGGWDFAESDDLPYDDGPAGFHGTHVSGIIGSDSALDPGVAPGVDLVSLRVFDDFGQGQIEWVEEALRWIHDNQHTFENPITTVNISIGTVWNSDSIPQWATLEEELQQLYNDGIVVTASAGNAFADYNTAGLSYPAASQYVLPVASVDSDGELSDFSQRHERALAAPGSGINSTIPDHVLGRDGRVDDFTTASGTSMAAPYVAGASVLVRQAMEMVGWESIDTADIWEQLQSSADSVFDPITGQNYDRLDLWNTISTILPADDVGDLSSSSQAISFDTIQSGTTVDTWINTLADQDVYTFTASASGTLTIDADSQWLSDLQWTLAGGGHQTTGGLESGHLEVVAGQQYELSVLSSGTIGPLSMSLGFEPANVNDPGTGAAFNEAVDLGSVGYLEMDALAGNNYTLQAAHDGLLTVVWNQPSAGSGSLLVGYEGQTEAVGQWVGNALRFDIQVNAGDSIDIALPGSVGETGQLAIANLVDLSGETLVVSGTLEQDSYHVDLSQGVQLQIGQIDYSFGAGVVETMHIDGAGNQDYLHVVGSDSIERVNLHAAGSTIENSQIQISISGMENISFSSGGGTDRVYLYDTDGDDTLRAHPRQAELVGVGYRFEVSEVSRIFIHATGGGEDYAYLYDSEGDDRLSARPQFTSITGDGFFNYVRGFERVYAYANAGGIDTAELYDSSDSDRFLTSGVSASVVGPGFSSYVRSFEHVNAYSTAGGDDRATLYGTSEDTSWNRGSDFVDYQQGDWHREARGFAQVETYQNGAEFQLGMQAVNLRSPDSNPPVAASDDVLFGPVVSTNRTMASYQLAATDVEWLAQPEKEQDALHAAFQEFGAGEHTP